MRWNLKLSQTVLILVCLPLLFQAIFVAVLLSTLSTTEVSLCKAKHSRLILTTAQHLLTDLYDFGAAITAFRATGSQLFLDRKNALANEIRENLTTLQQLVQDDNQKVESVLRLRAIVLRANGVIDEHERAERQGETSLAFNRLLSADSQLEHILSRLLVELGQFLKDRNTNVNTDSMEAHSRQTTRTIVLTFLVANAVLSLLLALCFNRGTHRRLTQLMENTLSMSQGRVLAPMMSGNDEIAQLDQCFHNMADALAKAASREHLIISNASDVICTLDAHNRFTSANPACVNLLGCQPAELMGQSILDLIQEEGKEKVESVLGQIKTSQSAHLSKVMF